MLMTRRPKQGRAAVAVICGLVYFHLLLAGLVESREMPKDTIERAS